MLDAFAVVFMSHVRVIYRAAPCRGRHHWRIAATRNCSLRGRARIPPFYMSPVAHRGLLYVEQMAFHLRAAFETSKLSSSIWKRVTMPALIVRIIANCVAVICRSP
jgi:hypothetical protein